MLPAVIGRRQACQVVLDTPDVSLGHALLLAIEGRLAVFDLGSRSGTYVNSERVTLVWLRPGDHLSIGGEQLTVHWEGAERIGSPGATAIALRTPHTTGVGTANDRHWLNNLGELGTTVEDLLARISPADTQLRDRTAQLTVREGKLETEIVGAQEQRDQLVASQRQVERQIAKLRAAWKELGEERSRLEDQRDALERERDQLEQQRAELTRRAAERQARFDTLATRERTLDERAAALATREKETAEREALLARREAACADTARRVAQLSEALSQAQRAFGSLAEPPGPPMAAENHPDTPAESRRAGGPATTPDTEGDAAGAILPAPLVDKPLFRGLEMARRSR